jgi:hypothetical protein
MMKEARMCHGRNCVHWAITEVERALGGTVGPGGKSVNDLSGIDSARQGKMQGYLTKGGKDAVKLPGGQVSEPVRGKMPGSVKALRWGGRIFLVGGIALSAYRIANAPEGHLGEVVGEEVGGHAGGLGGAALGAAGCVAFGIATGGVGLLLCGLGGGFLGAIGGTKVGGAIGTAVDTIASLPELMAQLFGVTGDLLKAAGNIASMPGQVLGMGLVAGREQLNPMNWDTRYMPPQVRADLFAIGNAIWARIEKLDLNGYLEHVSQPISALGVPADAAGRLAAGMVAIAQSQGQANAALTGDDILKMPALEFNRYMREWRLAFIQDPEYIAGFGGMFEDERYLTLHLMPLLQTRAMVNPKNWDLSAIPAMDFDDGSDVDNQGLIEQVGEAAWAKLESLRQDELPKVLPKTLPFFGIGEPVFAELAKGVGPLMAGKSGVPLPGELDADADLFREQTPESFVRFLQEYKTGFKFKHEPHEVAATALSWVRSGFQPW